MTWIDVQHLVPNLQTGDEIAEVDVQKSISGCERDRKEAMCVRKKGVYCTA